MSDIKMACLEVGRNRRTCAGMDAAMTRIAELEAQVNRTCLWEIDDVRWYPDALRIVGEKLHRDLSEGVYDRPNYCPACGGKVVSDG